MQMEAATPKTLTQQSEEFIQFLVKRDYGYVTMRNYRKGVRLILEFATERNILAYDNKAERAFLDEYLGRRDISNLTIQDRQIIRCASILREFIFTGGISGKVQKEHSELPGICAVSVNELLTEKENGYMAAETRTGYTLYLSRFGEYLEKIGLKSISDLTPALILDYAVTMQENGWGSAYRAGGILRVYLRFLHRRGYLTADYAGLVPDNNYKKRAKLPSMYSDDEITDMINGIDRSSPKGKRDYAMIMLAAHLGLRAGDVCNLRLENIDWEKDLVKFEQQKNKKTIELPLMAAVGNAVLEYLQYGRPKSDSDFVFLSLLPGFEPMTNGSFYYIVNSAILNAHIVAEGRKKGPHSLRHSLAGRLLRENTPLPTISEIFDHESPETTDIYLRTDVEQLRKCALDVPETDYYVRHNRGWIR